MKQNLFLWVLFILILLALLTGVFYHHFRVANAIASTVSTCCSVDSEKIENIAIRKLQNPLDSLPISYYDKKVIRSS